MAKEKVPGHFKFELKEPTCVSRQNSSTSVTRSIILKTLFTEDANEIFTDLPNSNKQEICTKSDNSFQKPLKEVYVCQHSSKTA